MKTIANLWWLPFVMVLAVWLGLMAYQVRRLVRALRKK